MATATRVGISAVTVLITLLLPAIAVATSPTGQWSDLQSRAGPIPGRGEPMSVYDVADGYPMMFGGDTTNRTQHNDTWVYVHGQWREIFPHVSPSARQGGMIAYDPALGCVVLFGGSNASGYLNDTWTYRGGNWTQLNPAVSPEPRRSAGMVYDPVDRRLLMYGGHNGPLYAAEWKYNYLLRMWAFSGGNWTVVSQGNLTPGARQEPFFGWDVPLQVAVLFGGRNATVIFGDTWEFARGNWTRLNLTVQPHNRDGGSLTYDPSLGKLVLFGGENTQGSTNDTWVFGGHWVQVSVPLAPPVRSREGFLWLPGKREFLMFSGRNVGLAVSNPASYYNDTWSLAIV